MPKGPTEDSPDHSDPKPTPSISDGLSVSVTGYDESAAHSIGNAVLQIIRECSRYLPLDNLDGVTIGADYKAALASVDRGFPTNNAPVPTSDAELGFGAAMALIVKRDGIVKTHVVFGPAIAAWLQDLENEQYVNEALQTIAHELGHVVDHEYKRRAFGNYAFLPVSELIPDPLERYLWEIGNHIWDEYFANRIAATFTCGDGGRESELFTSIQGRYRERILSSRRQYHLRTIDLGSFLEVVRETIRILLMAIGYLLGFEDAACGASNRIEEVTPILSPPDSSVFRSYHDVLLAIWDRRGEWNSYDEILALNKPTLDLLHSLRIFPSLTADNNLYMDVPVILE